MLKLKTNLNNSIDQIKHKDSRKLLSGYIKPYDLGETVCIVGFYCIKDDKKVNMSLEELSMAFKRRKIKCADVIFDVKHIKVGEEYAYSLNRFGYVGFNEDVQPLLIAYNRYPKYDDVPSSKNSWGIISFEDYFKENPTINLEYIDYKYVIQYMSVNTHIPKNINKVLSIIVNNHSGNRYV